MDASGQQTTATAHEQKPYVLSSNIRQPKASISVFHCTKLQLDKYLQGRSYQLFKRGVKAPKTYSTTTATSMDFVSLWA